MTESIYKSSSEPSLSLFSNLVLFSRRIVGDFSITIYNRLSLDLNLLSLNIICEPVLSFNGGVLDFKVIYKGQEYYAGGLLTYARLTEMLERWKTLTGQTPAYKLTSGQELQNRTDLITH